MDNLFIIIGLGNPGAKYENTRHNIGFKTVDLLSHLSNIKVSKLRHKALIGDGLIQGQRVILAKPQTFMNLCGESVRGILQWYKVPFSNVIIIYDDVDLPLGKVRIRPKGSSGTHNGMKSVIYQLQNDEFPRIRIGIDTPPEEWDLADYVLSQFSSEEMEVMKKGVIKAAEAVTTIIKSGVECAMNQYNGD